MADSNTIFREKSLEKVSSPEQLDSYLKVTSLGVWAILAAIILVLVGAVIWGTVGKIESKLTCVCVVQDEKVKCSIPSSNGGKVDSTMSIDIDDNSYQIESDPIKSIASNGELIYDVSANCPGLDNGAYEGTIVIERISPLKFVFN